MFELNQIFLNEYPAEAVEWCYASGEYCIYEIERTAKGERQFQIQRPPAPSESILQQQMQLKAEAQRVPDLEDATVELLRSVEFDGNIVVKGNSHNITFNLKSLFKTV